jgi:hypothetical protein
MMDVTKVTKEHILTRIDAQRLGNGKWVHKRAMRVGSHGGGAIVGEWVDD